MTLTADLSLGELLRAYPEAAELFSWYGVPIDHRTRRMSLARVCDEEGIDLDDALEELGASLDLDVDEEDYADDDYGEDDYGDEDFDYGDDDLDDEGSDFDAQPTGRALRT